MLLKVLKRFILGVAFTVMVVSLKGRAFNGPVSSPNEAELGKRLFKEERFSTARGDLPASCSHCHLFDEDPQGFRAHADFLAQSWVSYRLGDPRRNELRNSPTLFDVGKMPRLHFDGEFGSLEELVKGTLSGRPMGWLPGEEEQAFEQIKRVVLSDEGSPETREDSYRSQFKAIYGVNVATLDRRELIDWVARAIAGYMRTLNSDRKTPYDSFIEINRLPSEAAPGEEAKAFAKRLLKGVSDLEANGTLKLAMGFDAAALAGLKLFFASDGERSAGNCVVCHAPPLFTDFSFHNIGISQAEYDGVHGSGSFAELAIPAAATAKRPSAQLRETPTSRKPGEADLGHWNFAELKKSPLRGSAESDDDFLNRMIGTFKTPTLRNLAFSQPYMHNGAYVTLEAAVEEIVRLSKLAREKKVRSADEELVNVTITDRDIAPLISFLNTLNSNLTRSAKK
jgi:cytochrome c peroxidase